MWGRGAETGRKGGREEEREGRRVREIEEERQGVYRGRKGGIEPRLTP
jgi:hypothetical protein